MSTAPPTRAAGLAAALLLAPALLSCVARERYEEAVDEATYYQRMYQDLEPYQGELEAKIELLEGRLALYEEEQPIEAAYAEAVDRRLQELERIAQGLGTPGDVTVLQVEGGYGYRLKDALLFDSGKAEIRAEGSEVLDRLADEIRARPHVRVWVRGHTDSVPIVKPETKERFPRGNLELATERALEVASRLIGRGLETDKVVVAGFGPSDPVAPNTSPEGRQQNRRVEILVLEEEPEGPSAPADAAGGSR